MRTIFLRPSWWSPPVRVASFDTCEELPLSCNERTPEWASPPCEGLAWWECSIALAERKPQPLCPVLET